MSCVLPYLSNLSVPACDLLLCLQSSKVKNFFSLLRRKNKLLPSKQVPKSLSLSTASASKQGYTYRDFGGI